MLLAALHFDTLSASLAVWLPIKTMLVGDLDRHGISIARWPPACGVPQPDYCLFYVCCAQPTVEIWVRQCSAGLDKDLPHVHTHLSQTRSLFAPTDLVIAVHDLAIWLVCYANHTGLPQSAIPPFLALPPSPHQSVLVPPPPLQPSYQEMHCTRPHADPCLHHHLHLIATLHLHFAPRLQHVVLQQHAVHRQTCKSPNRLQPHIWNDFSIIS